MKLTLILLTAAVGLTMTAINSQAQDTGTYTHSAANGQGGMDTLTVTKPLPPPPGPKVAMCNRALDSANPFIAVNDPTKVGQIAPKGAVWNHDGQAFAGYVRSQSYDSSDDASADAQPDLAQYHKNVKSGKWHEFKNGE
jgi:hypothetical protein